MSHFKINYLQVKAIEKLEEVRDSPEVQTLMRQQKPVQHHIHVVLCEIGKKKGKSKMSEIEDIYIRQQMGILSLKKTSTFSGLINL